MIKLENWYITGIENPYQAPELRKLYLVGNTTGHPLHKDGKLVTTSSIVNANGRVVHTSSGSGYELGRVDCGYREWLKENRPKWDEDNPITMLP
jgi:hypothetical protein